MYLPFFIWIVKKIENDEIFEKFITTKKVDKVEELL